MLCDALATVLRTARADFNARFAAAKRIHPTLDQAAFTTFVHEQIDPLVQLAPEEHRFEVVEVAWDHGLELVARQLAGPQARHPWINETWRRLGNRLAATPRRLIPALSNAAQQIAATPGARPRQWLDLVEEVGKAGVENETLLQAGQVAAWRSGMAHYRDGAVRLIAALDPAIARLALGASSPGFVEAAVAGPWVEPPARDTGLRVGGFRGFGGLFVCPPLVRASGDRLFVRAGDDAWLLTADSFGATLHRVTAAEFEAGSTSTCDRVPPDIGRVRSAARTPHTVAVTGALTHAVLLFAA